MNTSFFIRICGIAAAVLFTGFMISCLDVDKTANVPPAGNNEGDSPEVPLEMSGLVQKTTALKGTLSGYSYFVLVTDKGKPIILFNQKKRSLGFDDYTDERVMVKGRRAIGTIGWRKQEKQGIPVEAIRMD